MFLLRSGLLLVVMVALLSACQSSGNGTVVVPTLAELPTLPPDAAAAQVEPEATGDDPASAPDQPLEGTEPPAEPPADDDLPGAPTAESVAAGSGANTIVIEGTFGATYEVDLPPGWSRDSTVAFNVVNGDATVSITQPPDDVSTMPLADIVVILFEYDAGNPDHALESLDLGERPVVIFTETQQNGSQTVYYALNLAQAQVALLTVQPTTPDPAAIRDDVLAMAESLRLAG